MKIDEMTLDVAQQVEVKADIGDVFKSVLHRFGEGSTNPNGESMNMTLEQWPAAAGFVTAATASAICGATYKSSNRPCCWN